MQNIIVMAQEDEAYKRTEFGPQLTAEIDQLTADIASYITHLGGDVRDKNTVIGLLAGCRIIATWDASNDDEYTEVCSGIGTLVGIIVGRLHGKVG